MDEGVGGVGGRDSYSDANIEKLDNGKLKCVGRLNRKRKTSLAKSRKKREKKQESCVTNATADEEDEESSDLPAVLSSTSATESMTKEKIKDFKIGKKTRKRSPNFAKIMESLNSTPFVFQKRLSRIDWRKLHTIDVDKVVREVDLDALESVLDTITFTDIQGEDTRNFSEANFIKIFRLAQLMVEYLLHVQELLATHKETLVESGAVMQHRVEKHREKQVKLLSDLSALRHEVKQAKKTLRTYEVMLRVQNKCQHRQQKLHESQREQHMQMQQQQQPPVGTQTVRCCPLCDKMFESAYYLDLHVARRHPQRNEIPEDKILAAVSKAEEITAARVRAETTAALQAEIKLVQAMSQAEIQRAQAVSQLQISSLEASVRESNTKLQEVQSQLQAQTLRKEMLSPEKKKKDNKSQEKLKEMDEKLQNLQSEMQHLSQGKVMQENSTLMKELASARYEVSHLNQIQEQSVLPGRDQGAHDWQLAKHATRKSPRSSSAERRVGKERRKWRHNPSTSPERSESEGRQTRYEQMAGNQSSSPERKRKQRWQHDVSTAAHSPKKTDRPWSATGRQRESPAARQRKYKSQEEVDTSPEKRTLHLRSGRQTPTSRSGSYSPKSQSGRLTPKLEVMRDIDTGVHTPQLEARFKDVGKKAFVIAKAEIEQDLVRVGGNSGKVATKIATFENKFGTKKVRREGAGSHRRSEDEDARSRQNKERQEAKEKRTAEEAIEEEARWKAEIADAAILDVGEDYPSIPPAEKEKWLEEHPYKPIPQRPHVLSRYPHAENVFSSSRDETAHRLNEQLGGELKKFGFGSDTAGISDPVYDAAKAALDKHYKSRVANLQLNQKKTLEYERGAILWQTQRAVRERDIQIIESHFEAESDFSSQHSQSAGSHSPFGEDETDDTSTPSQQGGKNPGWSNKSPIIKSPQRSVSPPLRSPTSPMSPHLKVHEQVRRETGHIAETLETLEAVSGHKYNYLRESKHVMYGSPNLHSPAHNHVNRFKTQQQSPPKSPYEHRNRKDADNGRHTTTYLFPTVAKFKQIEENSRLKDEDENQGEAFGLGQWDSDEDAQPTAATTLRTTLKHHKKDGDNHKSSKASRAHPQGVDHDEEESDESKIFQELDAEIDEIIHL